MAAAGLELTEGLEGLVTADLSMSVELEPSPKSSSGAGRGEPEDWATSPVLLASRGSPKDGATEVVPFAGYEDDGEENYSLPTGFNAPFCTTPLSTDLTTDGIALLHAPRPFNMRSGKTRRTIDVPLINNW